MILSLEIIDVFFGVEAIWNGDYFGIGVLCIMNILIAIFIPVVIGNHMICILAKYDGTIIQYSHIN